MKPIVAEQCHLLTLSDYLMRELSKVGVSCRLERLEECGDGEPLNGLIHLDCKPPKTLAVRLHRSGPCAGKLEIPAYTGPFSATELEHLAPDIAARVMADC